jgi:tellurite resistance protein
MFLKLLNEESQQVYFLNLAYLVAISDGDEGSLSRLDVGDEVESRLVFHITGASSISKTIKPELVKQKTRIDDTEINMIKTFMFEMGYMNYTADLETFEVRHLEENLNEWIRKSRKEISQAPDAKKMVMLSLAEKDFDIITLSQDDIENELMNNPETRSRIFAMAGNIAAQKPEVNFTMTQKKAVIFELVGMAYADGSFSELELVTVKSISEGLGVDEETFDDVCSYVSKLNQISAESLELIQE